MASYEQESRAAGREVLPDLTRAFALFGIALVNVGVFAWPIYNGYAAGGLETMLDRAAYFAVGAFFLLKSYSLFSFMFGVGFAYQMTAAQKRGVGFAGRYWRRIAGLLVLGIINVVCLFIGDILVVYAVMGSLLFLFRNAGTRTLINWGKWIYGLQVVVVVLMATAWWMGMRFAPEEMAATVTEMDAMEAASAAAFGAGSFAQAAQHRFAEWSSSFPMMIMFQGIGAFAFFLLGLSAMRSGVISDPSAAIWRTARRLWLPLGVAGSMVGGWLLVSAGGMADPNALIGIALVTLFSPLSSAGYVGLIAKWAAGPGGPVRDFMARAGTSSLTAYLMQGLLLSLIFSAYGLGLYQAHGAAVCVAIGAGVAVFSLVFCSLWRLRFRRGPMEAILRSWTYLGAR